MINKITGYSAFRSYGEHHYPTLKQGKELQLENKVWESTLRQADQVTPLNNFHYQKTIYKQNHTENTNPKDYHPSIVPKGSNNSLNFAANSITQPYDKEQMSSTAKDNFLKTGVEHWKTNYQVEMAKSMSKTQNTNWNNSSIRAQSLKKEQEQSKKQSYKNRPYISNCKTGVTEYKFSMGEKIGSKPTDLLDQYSKKQKLIENPLKKGTNQMWTQIPGYQGFKPSEIPFNELKQKIEQRASINKGSAKLNLAENYHVNLPGYAGFKPMYTDLGDKLRSSCLSYK